MLPGGAEILNYKGDAGLAVGSSGVDAIPEYGPANKEDGVVSGFKDFMGRVNIVDDAQQKQRIKDRDAIFDQIATQKMDLDKVLPEARQPLLDKIKEVEDMYVANPDLSKNPEAYRKMQDKLREFNELNAYAKTNYVTTTKDLAEAAKIDDPDDRKLYLDHIRANRDHLKDNPYDLYEPYAKPLKMDYDAMAPVVPVTTKKIGENGYNDITVSHVDPNEIIKNYEWGVVEGNDSKMRNRWLDFDQKYLDNSLKAPEERLQEFQKWNDKIIAANKYMQKDIKVVPILPNGMPDIGKDFTLDDFHKAAAVALRFSESDKVETPNKDRAALDKTKSEIEENKAQAKKALLEGAAARTKALSDKALKGSQIRLNDSKTKKLADAMKADAEENKWSYAYLAAALPKTKVYVTDNKSDGTKVQRENFEAIAVRDMPKPLQSLTADYDLSGKKISTGAPLTPFVSKDGVEYYTSHPVKDTYIGKDGSVLDRQTIVGRDNSEYKKGQNNPKIDYKDWLSSKGLDDTEDNWVKYFVDKKKYVPEIIIGGKDGSATTQSIESNQTIRDNKSKSSKFDTEPEGLKDNVE